ncbi:protein of unknown function (plasmid) [Caballeronia sp. S22]
MSQPWHSQTKMHGSYGHSWPAVASSRAITRRQKWQFNLSNTRIESSNNEQQETSADCLGNHYVMAEQVRPWSGKSENTGVRDSTQI